MSIGLRTRLALSLPSTIKGKRKGSKAPSPLAGEGRGEVDLGLPGIREQRKREKLDRVWRRVWRTAIWTILLAAFFLAGYNTRINFTEAKHRAEVVPDIGWTRIAMLVPQSKRKCAMDWREGCLVCEHRSLSGTVRSTMC